MGDDHSLDALSYMGMKVQSSPYVPAGQALIVDQSTVAKMQALIDAMNNTSAYGEHATDALKGLGKGLAGLSADFVIIDELAHIEPDHLAAVADGNMGVLRRAALKEIERREREQAELEKLPGYGSF